MDVIEECLEGFIEHVCEVVFKLLCSLDCKEEIHKFGKAGQIFLVVAVISVPELIRGILKFETHVAADSPAFGIFLHMRPHLINGILLRFDAHVGEDAVFGVKQFAEPFEKQHVRGQLAFVFMFDAEEHVVVGFVVAVLVYFGLGFVEVDPRVSEIVLLHPHWVEDGLVQP